MSSIETMKVSGKDYAKVASRLKDFREKHPRASVKTSPKPYGEGGMMIQAYILTDKSDASSADATGTAVYSAKEMSSAKAFEKLETIAVGRALAMLGWLNSGEIASSEEMAEFEAMREEKRNAAAQADIEKINAAKTTAELLKVWQSVDKTNDDIVAAKDKRKAELSESTATGAK